MGTAEAFGYGRQMPWELRPRDIRIVDVPKLDMQVNMSPQIAFGHLSGRDDEPIIPALQNLLRFTTDAINSFAEEFA
jgi:hypothetical protein